MKEIQQLISEIIDFSKKSKSFSGQEFIDFVNIFYSQNHVRDFDGYSPEALFHLAALNFEFISNRKENELKIRIANPSQEKNGFNSKFTIIDILNTDMPFLVDSTVNYLEKYGIKISNILHPVFGAVRDKDGKLQKISTKDGVLESSIQIHIEKIDSPTDIEVLGQNISKILENVALVVGDWKSMVELSNKASKQIENAKKLKDNKSEIGEIQDFVNWLNNGNFIFLGAKEFDVKEISKGKYELIEVKGSSFGIFNSKYDDFRPEVLNSSVEEVCDLVSNPYVIEILKSRYRSRVHRFSNAERIRIQKISADGKVVGEFRFIGLYTSAAYSHNPKSIPLIRYKIDEVIKKSGYAKGSHSYKDLISVLEAYPRDELFQISVDDLLKNSTGIVAICGRSQVRFFARQDKFKRFVSCLIFTPRDRSNSELRERIKGYLAEIYDGEIADSFVQITESNLTRLHIIIRTNKPIPQIDEAAVEDKISAMTRVWVDDLKDAISAKFEGEKSFLLYARYKNAFSLSYQNRFDSRRAAIDIARIEECLSTNNVLFNLYKSSEVGLANIAELKIYSPTQEISLSKIMPILESFGFNVIQEHTYSVTIFEDEKNRSQKKIWIQYFHLNLSKNLHEFSEKIKLNFEKTISKVWYGDMQAGLLNRLVITADLSWKQIFLLRAYTKYLYQTGFRYSSSYVSDVLVKYRDFTRLLVELFEAKFDPFNKFSESQRKDKMAEIQAAINANLSQIKDIMDDTVARRFLGLVNSTLRTNYYQSDEAGEFKGYVSLKFDCKEVPGLPLPLPYAEIFVYSTRVEAVHLRGGKVARGGLRWSDRHEDFRTEVLGLMKAQMTKNAVIVPVGSKGGFVVKRDTSGMSRDEVQKEGIECYKIFLSGLLDITDNVISGKIQHPQNVVIHDGEDPYLVVAADKGTATFSDIANSVSAKYNFWLGDAFASGGSVGYDHKKMGITAKGGWISVMRHFREMGIDSQSQDFTCTGIGDLAGDVFGNGMLLSKHIKLVAAFNHMHIFLDPKPDTAKSFIERERMFNLPRSTWDDYDKSLISKGGGVFLRSEKSIKISAEVKKVLDIEEDELDPTSLIRAILKAPTDLLWNGGIGTYVKAFDEANQDVGDRANDALRINGSELRCKVVGEGGNLGFTQKGRIEYALNGGRINTDAMDNSAGVDCSDHEVNIKIALIAAMRDKKIDLEQRNKILESMTDNVSDLVLADNRLQTQAISIALNQGFSALGDQGHFIAALENTGLLNRKIEFLPSKKDLEKRQNDKIGLTRPELCVMMAYAKMDIYNNLLASDLLKDKYFESELLSYFPKILQEKFPHEILNHQLRNEIIATQITNFVVNKSGITFINQISQNSGFALPDVIKAFVIAFDSFDLRKLWEDIENLDGKVSPQLQLEMFTNANKSLERSILWLLRSQNKTDIATMVTGFRKIANELRSFLPQVLAESSKESFDNKSKKYIKENIDPKLAERVASMDPVASAFNISEISAGSNFDLKTIAKIYFAVGTRFSLKWLRGKASELSFDNYWQKISTKTISEDLYSVQMEISKAIVKHNCDKACDMDSMQEWIKTVDFLVARFDSFIADVKVGTNMDLSIFVVALNRLKCLV